MARKTSSQGGWLRNKKQNRPAQLLASIDLLRLGWASSSPIGSLSSLELLPFGAVGFRLAAAGSSTFGSVILGLDTTASKAGSGRYARIPKMLSSMESSKLSKGASSDGILFGQAELRDPEPVGNTKRLE